MECKVHANKKPNIEITTNDIRSLYKVKLENVKNDPNNSLKKLASLSKPPAISFEFKDLELIVKNKKEESGKL